MNMSMDILWIVVKTLYSGHTDININNVQDLLEASIVQVRLETVIVERQGTG